MRVYFGALLLSATDLSAHAACPHLTQLRLQQHLDGGEREPRFEGPGTAALRERGMRHEREYLDHLRTQGRDVLDLGVTKGDPREKIAEAIERTTEAIAVRQDVIAQARFQGDPWGGSADVLLWDAERARYRVVDTKLSRETKGGTILQLMVYAELLDAIAGQRTEPQTGQETGQQTEWVGVVAPDTGFQPEWHRVAEYSAYYRLAKRRLLAAIEHRPTTYPEPVDHCALCNWWQRCDKQRRTDDHLSLVAGMTRGQRREATDHGVATLEAFAEHDPALWKPDRGSLASLQRAQRQAKIQLAGRQQGRPLHELLPRDPEAKPPIGLAMLPEPDPCDLFFDIEGDRFAGEAGLEYLFGTVTTTGAFTARWALNPAEERAMFERFIDDLTDLATKNPGAHIYHFGHYEVSALKRLAQRYGTREHELDSLLRGGRFVDLYRAVKTALIASVESYSIKALELHYGFERTEDVERSRAFRRELEILLEQGATHDLPAEMVTSIAEYNREDCESTRLLRAWLEGLRQGLVDGGEAIARPAPPELEEDAPRDPDLQNLINRLTADVPADPAERTEEQQARATLAALTEYHHREQRNAWWEFIAAFDREDEEDHLEAANTLAGLTFLEEVPPNGKQKKPRLRFSFPDQRYGAFGSQAFWAMDFEDGLVGTIDDVDREAGLVTISVKPERAGLRPSFVVVAPTNIHKNLEAAILALAKSVADHGVESTELPAALALLTRRPPVINGAVVEGSLRTDAPVLEDACQLAEDLTSGILAIQGPPGTGKTYTGAELICRLVKQGKKVGVCALSHEAIRGLLTAINNCGRSTRVAHAGKGDHKDVGACIDSLRDGDLDVVGATSFQWCKQDARGSIDVLVIEEAGQLTLADALAASTAAPRLIMLGDPQQLEAPQQGSHPEGSGTAALAHYIGEHDTIPDHMGLFLDRTRRLSTSIARFTSEQFYEGRLEPFDQEVADQHLEGDSPFAGAGMHVVAVEHTGNQSHAPEEVEEVARLVEHLTDAGLVWVKGSEREAIMRDDILIVAPYNAQVAALKQRLPGARIGTVDKFQGKEAPIVIISMATSTPEDGPRGMEFLYSRNRLNVATSRARCAVILVCNPAILEPECRTPRQMRLANGYAALLEQSSKNQLVRTP